MFAEDDVTERCVENLLSIAASEVEPPLNKLSAVVSLNNLYELPDSNEEILEDVLSVKNEAYMKDLATSIKEKLLDIKAKETSPILLNYYNQFSVFN